MNLSAWGRRIGLGIWILGLLALISRVSFGQVAGGTILGTVSDPSSAVVNNAAVAIKDVATGVVRQAVTNSLGLYSAPNLRPGEYEVTVSAPGFSPGVATGIKLTVGAQQTVDFVLKVGKGNEQVQVTGEAPIVELTSSSTTAQVDGNAVRELPLNGRDWTQLATLQPGVSTVRGQIQTGTVPRDPPFGRRVASARN
ncbi:MAG: carboxypeptidase-like regulatory domain-containing protein [Terriglobia bacterium]